MLDDLGIIAQIIEAALLPLSLIYLAREAQLNVKLTRAQFSHTLTDRLYERYLSSTQNEEFVAFLAKDFSSEELTAEDQWRVTLWTNTMLVDLFDTFGNNLNLVFDGFFVGGQGLRDGGVVGSMGGRVGGGVGLEGGEGVEDGLLEA